MWQLVDFSVSKLYTEIVTFIDMNKSDYFGSTRNITFQRKKTTMSSDIISSLQLDRNIPSRMILVKEVNGCDGSFINSCVLSHCIRNKKPVFFITTHNSLNHYQNVGLKMNYNLQKNIDTELFEFYNLGDEYFHKLLNQESSTLQDIFLMIKERFLTKQAQFPDINIVIDGVSHLFDLQFTLKDVNKFCTNLFNLLKNKNAFVIYHCNEAYEDDVTSTMANLLGHKSHTIMEVKSLQSGWSTDVSGHLTVKHPGQRFEKEHMFTLDVKPTAYLFKLFDRGVKLLAPGTV